MTGTPGRPRGPYAKTAKVRARILEACAEVFARLGYRATTMKEVAERAQISERGLVHHFSSKEALLRAALDQHERDASAHVPSEPGLAGLVALTDLFAANADRPGLVEFRSMLAAEGVADDHPAHELFRSRYEQLRAYVTAAFEALHIAGELSSPLPPRELAAAYIALSDGLELQWLYDRTAVEPVTVLRHFLESVVPRYRAQGQLPHRPVFRGA